MDVVPSTEKSPEPQATSNVHEQPEENEKEEDGEENEGSKAESVPKTVSDLAIFPVKIVISYV